MPAGPPRSITPVIRTKLELGVELVRLARFWLPRPGCLADHDHQLVERGVVASGEGEEGGGPLKDTPFDRRRDAIRPEQQSHAIGVQGVGESTNQGVRGAVAVIRSFVLNPTRVTEPDADLPGRVTPAPLYGVSKLSHPPAERHLAVTPLRP